MVNQQGNSAFSAITAALARFREPTDLQGRVLLALCCLGLWALQPWARTVAMIIAGISLFEAVLAFFQFPGTGIGFAMAIMPGIILWYLSGNEVKAAFGEEV